MLAVLCIVSCPMLALSCLFSLLCASAMIFLFFCLMIRRPPRSTLDRSSAASDVYKRQFTDCAPDRWGRTLVKRCEAAQARAAGREPRSLGEVDYLLGVRAVSYTHLRAHETVLDLVCRLLLENKKTTLLNSHHCCVSSA